jgi:hypothetical protein
MCAYSLRHGTSGMWPLCMLRVKFEVILHDDKAANEATIDEPKTERLIKAAIIIYTCTRSGNNSILGTCHVGLGSHPQRPGVCSCSCVW